MLLEHLNKVNDTKIYSVFSEEFKTYGKIVEGFDFSCLISYMKENTAIPESGNIYVPSVPEMEECEICGGVRDIIYGSMPIQTGYCNGRNSTYNGFEYHKGSEINIAVTDFVLVLGHTWEIEDNKFYVGNEKLFFVPQGTAIEMYQTTLHLSPCKVTDEGFMDIVILPKGTNTPLEKKSENPKGEEVLLLQKNKWVLAHPEREPLIKQGAFPGLVGENKVVHF